MTTRTLPPALFFIHVMKTAGGTFRNYIHAQYGKNRCFPIANSQHDGEPFDSYMQLDLLRNLPAERHRQVDAYSGHYPYCATSYVDRELITATILRDPVDRIVSYLRDARRHQPLVIDAPLEEIYEHPLLGPCLILNHQVKVFALAASDEPESVMTVIDFDEQRLALARDHLADVELIGRQEDFDTFLAAASRRLGWRELSVPEEHVGCGDDASKALRRRIEEDNAADIEFYEYALELMAERGTI